MCDIGHETVVSPGMGEGQLCWGSVVWVVLGSHFPESEQTLFPFFGGSIAVGALAQ